MTHLTVSQRTLLGRTYQSAQAIASSGTTEENDEFCRTIPIFGANFESCNIFLPKCGFPAYSIPPNRFFRHFRATTGVCDVARFQKMTEKWNRATFTECRTCRNRRNHVTMARKTHSKLRFSCILMLRVPLSVTGIESPENAAVSIETTPIPI